MDELREMVYDSKLVGDCDGVHMDDESEAVSDPAVIDDDTFVRLAVPSTVDDLENDMVAVALLLLRLRDIDDVVGTVGETERVVLE